MSGIPWLSPSVRPLRSAPGASPAGEARAEALALVRWYWPGDLARCSYYFYLDNERTFDEARNRGVDILSTDEKTGVVTARDKLTGKIITMDFNDIGRDPVRVETIGMPSWIPSYPNVADSEPSKNGSFSLSTPDSVAEAAGFYESELRKAGMTVTRQNSSAGDSLDGVTLTARDAVKNRSVTVVVERNDSVEHYDHD